MALEHVGLFAGIGGIELGLERAGWTCTLLCEVDPDAQSVLRRRFPDTELVPDVFDLDSLPPTDLVTAGFPCQDLSQAGQTAGINGDRSSVVSQLFRLVENAKVRPEFLLIENVPFMLHLERGEAMRYLVEQVERLGYRWAYRIVDSRAFGVPQRRRRVLFLASRDTDPSAILHWGDEHAPETKQNRLAGFYWTEGTRGLGWAEDATPPLKGGSGLGIPAPPAIWDRATGEVFTPDIRDCERLQGLRSGWTRDAPTGSRWRLVGNAVTVPVAQWLGQRIETPDLHSVRSKRVISSRWAHSCPRKRGTVVHRGGRRVADSKAPKTTP